MDLSLDDEQAGVLRELLDSTLRDLSYEISNTDNSAFKRDLRQRNDVILAIREKLGG